MTHATVGKGCLGVRVRVRELDSMADELQSIAGTLMRDFGHPDHAAQGAPKGGGSSQLL